jgi:hypothetical protein
LWSHGTCIYSTLSYLYDDGPVSGIALRGILGDNPDDVLDVSDGDGFAEDDAGEKGEVECSSKSD